MLFTLINPKKNFYKANLHCHTNISDGVLSPEQIKIAYLNKGYSIVAYSDHELFLRHNELTDKKFVAINATELSICDPDYNKTVHLNLFAKNDDIEIHPLWHREKYLFANNFKYKSLQKFDNLKENYERVYCPQCINEMIKIAKKSEFIVSLNHIEWSLDDFKYFSKYRGMHSCEIYNSGCAIMGWDEDDSYLYDLYLRQGKHIYCVCGDDNHNVYPIDSPKSDSFHCFTMFNISKLNYKSVIKGYLKGYFYSSTGPQITCLTFDSLTKKIHVECSECERITLHTDNRANDFVVSMDGKPLTEADFILNNDSKIFRLKIHANGRLAWTNGYFVKDLK